MSPRRSNGEGSAPRKRKDGRWQIDARTTHTTTGEPTRKTFYGRTRVEVVDKAKAWRNKLAAGGLEDPTRATLADWINHWLEHIAPTRVRERTLYGYSAALRKWVISSPAGSVRLEALTAEHIEQIHARMRAAGSSEANIRSLHRILSRALKVAVQRGRLGWNPAERVETAPPERFSPAVLTPEQARILITAASQPDCERGPSWVVALALGLRQGERLGLRWQDVDLDQKRLQVRGALGSLVWKHGCGGSCGRRRGADCPQRHGGGYRILPTKSAAGDRVVPLPGVVVQALERQQRLQHQWKIEAGESWDPLLDESGKPVDLVFTRCAGGPWSMADDRAGWRKFLRGQGVDPVRVHDARHTAATVLLALGVDGRVVMEIMGWSQVSMLHRYQHVVDSMLDDVSSRLDGAFSAVPPTTSGPPEGGSVVDFQAFRARRGA